jgi:hypothetical protein
VDKRAETARLPGSLLGVIVFVETPLTQRTQRASFIAHSGEVAMKSDVQKLSNSLVIRLPTAD